MVRIYIFLKLFIEFVGGSCLYFTSLIFSKLIACSIFLLLSIALRPNMGTSPRLPNGGGISPRFTGKCFFYALVKFRLSSFVSIYFPFRFWVKRVSSAFQLA